MFILALRDTFFQVIKMFLNESSVHSVPFYKFVGFIACTELVKQRCIKKAFFYF